VLVRTCASQTAHLSTAASQYSISFHWITSPAQIRSDCDMVRWARAHYGLASPQEENALASIKEGGLPPGQAAQMIGKAATAALGNPADVRYLAALLVACHASASAK
jgi:hypothetical protein